MLIVIAASVGQERRGDAVADTFGDRRRVAGVGVDEDHGELLAAVARRDVDVADRRLDDAGDATQGRVAGAVSVLVVEGLEVVEVAEQQCQRRARVGGGLDLLGESFVQDSGG